MEYRHIEEKWIEEKRDIYKGYTYLVLANCKHGYRCGYVQIPEGHIYYENRDFRKFNVGTEINWGLTFSGRLKNQTGWWIGFDCNHSNNGVDVRLIRQHYSKEDAEYLIENELFYKDYGYAPGTESVAEDCELTPP